MKTILIRSNSNTQSVFKAAEALAHDGQTVTVLVWDRGSRAVPEPQSSYSLIRFRLGAPHDRISALLFLPLWWVYEFLILLKFDADVFHPCDLDTLAPAILASVMRKKILCYTIYDFYADNLPDGFAQPLRASIRKVLATIECSGIRFAAILFLVDESRLVQVKGAKVKRVVYAYNSPPDRLNPCGQSEVRTGRDCVIFYAGSLIKEQRGLEQIIAAVEGLDGVTLRLAGTGPDEDYLKHLAARSNNVRFLGWLKYEEMLR